ncbi:MAG TPA: hypothetical protein PLF50_02505 [Candidatus Cloacimonadota bacterium]|nr:hypothetical protein [Candidatus Cloacimonadota bacterium]
MNLTLGTPHRIKKSTFDIIITHSEDKWLRCEITPGIAGSVMHNFADNKTEAVFASGSACLPMYEHYGLKAIGGIDRVRYESKPQLGEPYHNIDHFAICDNGDPDYYFAYLIKPKDGNEPGPFNHWSTDDDFATIIDSIDKTISRLC